MPGNAVQPDPEFERELDAVIIGERTPGPVTLVEYDDEWPRKFEAVSEELARALGEVATAIEHIGSTAVPGLAAKRIIDVLVAVDDVEPEDAYSVPLAALGYELRVREEGHRLFRPPARDVHIHVWAHDSAEARNYLIFRNRLRSSPAARDEYDALKRDLAKRGWPDVNYYARAKTPLIKRLTG